MDVLELDDEIRRGKVPCTAEVRHTPWTGSDFARIESIPALAEAVDAPDARAAAHFQRAPFPWAAVVTGLMLLGAFAVQIALGQTSLKPPFTGALGFEPTILDGAWWSVWTAPWLHADAFHLLSNLALLAYCSFRVERAMGPGGLALTLIGSILGATLLIVPFSSLPVVGSSILAYGVWGAQFGVGLRFGEVIPRRLRGAYGWGTFLFFPLLLVASFSSPQVSVLGHVGGYVGGLFASLVARPAIHAPRAAVAAARIRVLVTSLLLLALPAGLAWGLAHSPTLLCPATRTVGNPKEGLELSICSRMSDFPASIAGMDAWRVGASSESAIFTAVAELRRPERLDPEWRRQMWASRAGENVTWTEEPAPREGWRTWTFTGATTTVREHIRVEGVRAFRVGWYNKGALAPARRAFYERLLDTAHVTESEELRTRRESASKPSASPEATYRYGTALEAAGRYDEAMALYARLLTREDGWEWEAARARFRVCAYHPAIPACGADWREKWAKEAPAEDVGIHLPMVRWLAAEHRCPEARERAQRLAQAVPELASDELKDALAACEGER